MFSKYNKIENKPKTVISSGAASSTAAAPASIFPTLKVPVYRDFNLSDTLLYPSSPQKEYESRSASAHPIIKWEQCRLTMTILHFVNLFYKHDREIHILYVGAAPGINVKFIRELYPAITWHLYSDAQFNPGLSGLPGINLHHKIFTTATAEKWSTRFAASNMDLLFISDIRTIIPKNMNTQNKIDVQNKIDTQGKIRLELAVFNDMKDQMDWVDIIKPTAARLKFRLPYTIDDFPEKIDITNIEAKLLGAMTEEIVEAMNGGGPVTYLNGLLFFQPWQSDNSTEGSLIVVPDDVDAPREERIYGRTAWNNKIYEDQIFYHTTEVRERALYYNPTCAPDFDAIDSERETARKSPLHPEYLYNRWDDMFHYSIFNDYLTLMGINENRHNLIIALDKYLAEKIGITVKINPNVHPRLYQKYPHRIQKTDAKGKKRIDRMLLDLAVLRNYPDIYKKKDI